MDSLRSLKRKMSNSFDSLENYTTVTKKSKTEVKFPKLYRLLGEKEDITKGLKAKDPNATISVV